MSKSKKNTVDPDNIIATFGADTARWFVLSDSPPERDVEWTQSGAEGAGRFVQRAWSLFNAISDAPRDQTANDSDAAVALRRASHKAVHAIDRAIEEFRFNSAIATIHEWVSTLKKAEQGGDLVSARLEGLSMLARCLIPFMPHLAEECWSLIGGDGLCSAANWPEIDESLLVEDSVTMPIQVNGKRRAEIAVSKAANKDEIEAIALAEPALRASLDGKDIKKVIVVPGRIVNIVV